MTDYTVMTPEERYAAVNTMATQLFDTTRWKTAFAKRYNLTTQGVGKWQNAGAPVWACVALRDALVVDQVKPLVQTLREIDI